MTVERILVTHGHLDHVGGVAELAAELGVPVEGPEQADRFWIARLADDSRGFGIPGSPFEPDRWLADGDTVTVGDLTLDVYQAPGHTPGHVIFHHAPSRFAQVGDVLFEGSVGRTDLPGGDHARLIRSVVEKLWPLGSTPDADTAFIPGHGRPSSFARERTHNPFVSDAALAGA